MRRQLSGLLTCAVVAGLVGCAASTSTPQYKLSLPELEHPRTLDFGRQGHWRLLDNGLRVLVLPDARSNLVTVDVRYRVGGAEDPEGKAGLAHLVEHLSFEIREDGGQTITERLATASLSYNAYTTADVTHYTATGHGKDLAELLAIESNRAQLDCSQLSQEMFERERDVVISEWRQRDNVEFRAAVARAVYGPDHPYSRPVGGTLESLERLERSDVCEFLEQYYGPASAILIVAGRVNEQRVDDLVTEAFGPLPSRRLRPRAAVPPPVLGGGTEVIESNVDEPMALVAFPAPAFSDPAHIHASYLRDDLERILAEIEEEESSVTGTGVIQFGGVRVPVYIAVLETTDRDAAKRAANVLHSKADKLGADIDQNYLRGRVTNRVTRLLLRSEAVAGRARWYADYAQFSRHPGFIAHALDNEAGVTAEDLQAYAPRFLRRKDSRTVIVMPAESQGADADESAGDDSVPDIDDFEYDIPAWDVPVEPGEVTRSLQVPSLPSRPRARTFELPNGLQVTLVSDLSYPLFDARLVLPVGSLDEPTDKPYLATVVAMLQSSSKYFGRLKGSKSRRVYERLMQMANMGGLLSVYVRQRTTTFRIQGLGRYADALLWKLYWSSFTGHYENKRVEDYNEFVSDMLEDDDEDQDGTAGVERERRRRLLRRAIFGEGHPYAAGAESPVPLNAEDLLAFRDDHYTARGARLIIVGRFDADVIEAQAKELFSEMRGGAPRARPAVPAARVRDSAGHLLLPTSDDQVTLSLAYAAAPGYQERAAARKVLVEMLQQSLSKARERLGSTYGIAVRGSYDALGPGQLTIRGAIDTDRAQQTVRAVLAELEALRAGGDAVGLTFARARRRVLSRLLASDADTRSEADARELAMIDELPDDFQERLIRQVATLRLEDVMELMAAELAPEQQVMLLAGPRERLTRIYRALGVTDLLVVE